MAASHLAPQCEKCTKNIMDKLKPSKEVSRKQIAPDPKTSGEG